MTIESNKLEKLHDTKVFENWNDVPFVIKIKLGT